MAPSMGVEALDTNYDARKYTICAPWYGERHPKFRLWQQAYIAGVADEGDDDAGLDQTLRGTDPGGPLWPAALAAEMALFLGPLAPSKLHATRPPKPKLRLAQPP